MRMPSLKHGMRGSVTRSTAVPIAHRSPITVRTGSIPSIVRLSPNVPGPSSSPTCSDHHR